MENENYSQSQFLYKGLPKNDKLKTQLYTYQAETVEWMIHRENTDFANIKGGLVLLDMGLGKTLCALSCSVLSGKTTLVIAPAQLVYVWQEEIKKHFFDVSFFTYYGPNRKKKFEKYLLENDVPLVMIMSFQSISSDITDTNGPLALIDFYRIIFDECHYIKNQNTVAFKTVQQIPSECKWFLSGTPIMNRVQEMYCYLKLLNYKYIRNIPQYNRHLFRYNDGKPLPSHSYTGMQNLLKTIAIRKTKKILNLPEKTYNDVFINMETQERQFYNVLKLYSKQRMKKLLVNLHWISTSGLANATKGKLKMIVLQSLLSLIFHLRLVCCDTLLVIDKIPRISFMPLDDAIEKLKDIVLNKVSSAQDCKICFNNFGNVINTDCNHKACSDCWKKLENIDNVENNENTIFCFECLENSNKNFLKTISSNDNLEHKDYHTKRVFFKSCKTTSIFQQIKKELDANNKVIIVSQWTMYLDKLILQFMYEFPEYEYVTLTGKTTPAKRQPLIEAFKQNDKIRVCFASLGSSSEGITLVGDFRVSMIFCDVFWNKAKVEQMSDRVHRIGQKFEVEIYNMFTNDTIEIKIKELVDKKDLICKVIVDCKPITKTDETHLVRMIRLLE